MIISSFADVDPVDAQLAALSSAYDAAYRAAERAGALMAPAFQSAAAAATDVIGSADAARGGSAAYPSWAAAAAAAIAQLRALTPRGIGMAPKVAIAGAVAYALYRVLR